jgi:hypothetical protein
MQPGHKDNNQPRLHYLAYGSNLHPIRLRQRVNSARLIATLSLPGYRVLFNKRGQDLSAKCNLVATGLNPGRENDGAKLAAMKYESIFRKALN